MSIPHLLTETENVHGVSQHQKLYQKTRFLDSLYTYIDAIFQVRELILLINKGPDEI